MTIWLLLRLGRGYEVRVRDRVYEIRTFGDLGGEAPGPGFQRPFWAFGPQEAPETCTLRLFFGFLVEPQAMTVHVPTFQRLSS